MKNIMPIDLEALHKVAPADVAQWLQMAESAWVNRIPAFDWQRDLMTKASVKTSRAREARARYRLLDNAAKALLTDIADTYFRIFSRQYSKDARDLWSVKRAMAGHDGMAANAICYLCQRAWMAPRDHAHRACCRANTVSEVLERKMHIEYELDMEGPMPPVIHRLSAPERISTEGELKRIEDDIRKLESTMQYDFDRTPEKVKRVAELRAQREELRKRLEVKD